MTGTEFKALINYYGEENILGIGFDNSASITFGKGEFTLANNYVEDIESIQMVGFDSRGNPYHTIKHVENVQGIVVKDKAINFDDYDRISIRM